MTKDLKTSLIGATCVRVCVCVREHYADHSYKAVISSVVMLLVSV